MLLPILSSVRHNRRLLKDFVVRDLKARYVGSSMGFFWSVVFPIINLFVFMFVFRLVLNARWSDKQGATEVALVMLAGIVVWSAFAETMSRSTNSLVENANLIQKVVFPSELLPVYLAFSSLINMCIGLPVITLCVLWFTNVSPPTVQFDVAEQRVGEEVLETTIPIHLSRGFARTVHVPFTFEGTAVEGEDFTVDPSPIVIPPASLRGHITLSPRADGVQEGDETLLVTLGDPGGVGLGGQRTHTITFADESAEPTGLAAPPEPFDPDYHPLDVGVSMLVLPVLFLAQMIFTVGLGCFLATLNLYLRDTFHLVGVMTTVWMFSTPIFYPAALVDRAGFGVLLEINPMHWLIDSYRAVLVHARWPDWWLLGRFVVVGTLMLIGGSKFFYSQKQRFPDLL